MPLTYRFVNAPKVKRSIPGQRGFGWPFSVAFYKGKPTILWHGQSSNKKLKIRKCGKAHVEIGIIAFNAQRLFSPIRPEKTRGRAGAEQLSKSQLRRRTSSHSNRFSGVSMGIRPALVKPKPGSVLEHERRVHYGVKGHQIRTRSRRSCFQNKPVASDENVARRTRTASAPAADP